MSTDRSYRGSLLVVTCLLCVRDSRIQFARDIKRILNKLLKYFCFIIGNTADVCSDSDMLRVRFSCVVFRPRWMNMELACLEHDCSSRGANQGRTTTMQKLL
jgi:hypothetical protein